MKVRTEFAGPNSYDEKAQLAEFQKAVRQKASGILVSPADPVLMKPEIDAAIAAGIPVITFDSDSA
jgi:ABC-type sugar transport system substrate-binding protein